ncbi:MAG: DUF302 domain-containing protein [Proteobacteria bacterium]|nr:DUF302 domain-containing protein [Pseudomonadota bacterium]
MRVYSYLLTLVISLGLLPAFPANADPLIMRRMSATFPETMSALQAAIVEQGYTVSRVQRVDIGLTKTGHKTDRYRLVLFGKGKEIRKLINQYPQLSPVLPLQFVIYAEEDETLVLINDMNNLALMYPDKALSAYFNKWNRDIFEILESTRQRVLE